MSNPLVDWEEHIIYLSEAKNIKYGKNTLSQIKRMKKHNKKRKDGKNKS